MVQRGRSGRGMGVGIDGQNGVWFLGKIWDGWDNRLLACAALLEVVVGGGSQREKLRTGWHFFSNDVSDYICLLWVAFAWG